MNPLPRLQKELDERIPHAEQEELFFKVPMMFMGMLNGAVAAIIHREYFGANPTAWTTARQDSMLLVGTVLGIAGLLYAVYYFNTPRARPFRLKPLALGVVLACLALASLGQIGWALWFDLGYRRA